MLRLVLALFFCASLSAQQTILLEGVVLNDTIEKSSLNVVNVSLRKGSVTNVQGVFIIPARVNDTINISAVQYESRQFVVTQKTFDRKKILLYLVPKITELGEVFLDNRVLSGRLEKDVNHKMLQSDLDAIKKADRLGLLPDISKKTIEERRLYTATTGTGENDFNFLTIFKIPLPKIINGISGKTKRLKKHVAVASHQKKVEQIKANFSQDFYSNTLKVREEYVEEFIIYLIQDHNLLELHISDKLLLLEFMQKWAPDYLVLVSNGQKQNEDD